MTQLDVNVFTGIIGVISIAISGWLTLRGKREEVAATQADALIRSQGERIQKQEERLDKLEAQMVILRREADEARARQRQAELDAHKATTAMDEMVDMVRGVMQWIADGYPPPPPELDLMAIERVQMDLARPRRAPDAL